MSRVSRSVVGVLIGLHFFFIVSVVTHLHDWMLVKPEFVPVAQATEFYSVVTFNNRNFGFFAPEVSGDWVVTLTLTYQGGRVESKTLGHFNREMQVKTYSMIGHFQESPDTMDLFARSWALREFNARPTLARVDVIVEQNLIPTMAEYRQRKRLTREFVYRTTFDLP